MRKLKKVMAVTVVTAIMAAGMDMSCVMAAENTSGEVVVGENVQSTESEFSIENGVLVKYQGEGGDVVIPDTVTSIGGYAFADCTSLNSVEIPAGITSIEDCAFSGCSNLTSVEIPSSVTNIGAWAFANCSNLSSVRIPEGVTAIKACTFNGCTSLSSVEIPEGVTAIGEWAFYNCGSISNLEIPSSVTKIGRFAFSGTAWLDKLEEEKTFITINNILIEVQYCEEVEIPEGVTTIASGAFYSYGHEVISVEIPSSVINIEAGAFDSCSQLTSLVIPESVKNIGESAFAECSNLSDLEIPSSVTNIGKGAFVGTKWLANKSEENPYVVVNGMLINVPCEENVEIPEGVTSIAEGLFSGSYWDGENYIQIKNVKIPSTVTSIGDGVFANSSIESVELPDSLTDIGKSAFANCSLKKIEIPSGVTTIGESAFEGSALCNDVVIPSSVTSIGKSAFANCGELAYITIPSSVTSIGESAFLYCGMWTQEDSGGEIQIYVERNSYAETFVIENGIKHQYIGETLNLNTEEFYVRDGVLKNYKGDGGDVVVPEGVTEIGERAFWRCTSLNSVELPNSVTSIGPYAFRQCSNLKNVELSKNLTCIESHAFGKCEALESIKIPNSVTSIGSYAFIGCEALETIEIPNSVTNIGIGTFNSTKWIENKRKENPLVIINNILIGGWESSGDVVVPEGVTVIAGRAFAGCNNISSIQIPSSVTSIGVDVFWHEEDEDAGLIIPRWDLTIFCIKDSYAETYAKENDIAYKYTSEITPSEPKVSETPTTAPIQTQQKAQTITAKNITKTYGTKAFNLGAKTNGNGTLTYKSANTKVATVSNTGKVTIKGCGKTTITIKAAETNEYKAAEKQITITVKPKKQKVASLKSTKAKTITVKWKKDTKATGYIIQYSIDKKFKKNVKKVTVSSNKTTTKKISKLKSGKKYYVRICSYKKASGAKIQGSYSAVKSVTVK